MPREQKQRLRARNPIGASASPRNLSVVARPTDPFGPRYSSDTADLLRGIGAIGDLAEVAGKGAKELADAQEKAGEIARGKGTQDTAGKSQAWIDGYERVDAEFKGLAYQNAVGKYVAENSHLSPDDFRDGLIKLQKEHLSGLSSDKQIPVFLPAALKADTFAERAHQDVQTKLLAEDRNARVTGVMGARAESVFNEALAGFGVAAGLSQLLEDPAARDRFEANKQDFLATVNPKIRALLDEKRAEYKALGLSTRDISFALMKLIGEQAQQYGVPELMGYAFEKDKDGVSVADSFPTEVHNFLNAAVTNGRIISNSLRAAQDRAQKDAVRKMVNNMYISGLLLEENDVKGAIAGLSAVAQNAGVMPSSDVSGLTKLYTDILERRGFRKTSEPTIMREMNIKWAKGELELEDLINNYSQLSPSDQKDFANKLRERETTGETPKDKKIAHLYTVAENLIKTRLRGTPIAGAPPEFITPQAGQAQTAGLILFSNLFEDKVIERGGKGNVTADDIFNIIERVVKIYEPFSKLTKADMQNGANVPSPTRKTLPQDSSALTQKLPKLQ